MRSDVQPFKPGRGCGLISGFGRLLVFWSDPDVFLLEGRIRINVNRIHHPGLNPLTCTIRVSGKQFPHTGSFMVLNKMVNLNTLRTCGVKQMFPLDLNKILIKPFHLTRIVINPLIKVP